MLALCDFVSNTKKMRDPQHPPTTTPCYLHIRDKKPSLGSQQLEYVHGFVEDETWSRSGMFVDAHFLKINHFATLLLRKVSLYLYVCINETSFPFLQYLVLSQPYVRHLKYILYAANRVSFGCLP